MGADKPKQFLRLGRRTVFSRSLSAMCRVEGIAGVVAVAPKEHLKALKQGVRRDDGLQKVRAVVAGGAERSDSVLAGLEAVEGPCDLVAVHDAARPLVKTEDAAKTVRVAARFGAAVLAVPVTDTIKQATDQGFVLNTPDRRRLWAAQTPQCFEYNVLLDAHRAANQEGLTATDDASLVERLGVSVVLVPGDYGNIKITTPMDLERARLILRSRLKEE